jgi:hypothetical protein
VGGLKIALEGLGDAGFGRVGRRHPHRTDQPAVQIVQHVQHVPLVAVHPHAAALAAVPQLLVLQADPSVAADPAAECGQARCPRFHILRPYLLGRPATGPDLRQSGRCFWQRVEPPLQRVHRSQDLHQRSSSGR